MATRQSIVKSPPNLQDLQVCPPSGDDRNQRALVVCNGECEGNHNTVFGRQYREGCNDLQITPNTGVLRLLNPGGCCVLRLRAISFKNFFLGDRGCDAVFEGLFPSIPHIELVNLSGTGMRTSAVEQMIHLFTPQEMPRLQSVDLSENPIPDTTFLSLLQWLVSNTSMFDVGAQGTLLTRDHQLVLMFQAIHNRIQKLGRAGSKVARDRLVELYKLHPEAAMQSSADDEFPGDVSKWMSGEREDTALDAKEPAKGEVNARMNFIVNLHQQSRERLRRQRTHGESPQSPNRHQNRKQIIENMDKSKSQPIVPKEFPRKSSISIDTISRKSSILGSATTPLLAAPSGSKSGASHVPSPKGSSKRSRSEGAMGPDVDGLPIWARQMARQYPGLHKSNKDLEATVAKQQEEKAKLEQKVAEQEAEILQLKEQLAKLEKQTKQVEEPLSAEEIRHKNRQSAELYAADIEARIEADAVLESSKDNRKSAEMYAADIEAKLEAGFAAEEPLAREGSHVGMVRQLRDEAKHSAEKPDEDVVDIVEDEETTAAALKIQSIQRGKQARKEVEKKKTQQIEQPTEAGEVIDIVEDEETTAAALKIQSIQRGKQARKEVEKKKTQQMEQPTEAGEVIDIVEDEETTAAALKIQSIQRGKKARKEVEDRKAQQTE